MFCVNLMFRYRFMVLSVTQKLNIWPIRKNVQKYKCFNHYVIANHVIFSKNELNTRKTDLQSNGDKQDCITTMGNGTDNTAILWKGIHVVGKREVGKFKVGKSEVRNFPFKGGAPVRSFTISNCNISALEHAYALKILLRASFLTLNKIIIKLFNFSKIFNNLGIWSESSHYC